MSKNAKAAGLSEREKWRTMIRNPKADGLKAAKAQSYIMWFIFGVLGHFITLAWASVATPRVPMAIDEESPTGHDDHEMFARGFQEKAKTERMRHAWMGTRFGAPLQVLAAVFTLVNAISDSGVLDMDRFAAATPTEQAELTNTASTGAGAAEAPADVPALETEPDVVSVRVPEDREAGDPGNRATAELLAGYECTPNAERGVFDCTRRTEAAAWVEPTGTWGGMYSRRGTPRNRTVEIEFGNRTTIQYPDSACSGTLTPAEGTPSLGEGRLYRETLTTGRGRCLNNGLVTLQHAAGGTALEFEWLRSNGSRRRVWDGLLTKAEF